MIRPGQPRRRDANGAGVRSLHWSRLVNTLCRRLPLLVTGITGVAGFNAFHHFQRRYPGQVIGIRPRQTWRLTGPGVVAQDAGGGAGGRGFFDRYRFRSLLNCVGNCALQPCGRGPGLAPSVNVHTAAVIGDCVRDHDARLVHLSSDLVYSGARDGNYVETDAVDPVTVYGKTMAQAEDLLMGCVLGAAILRISLPMGPSFNRHAGAIDWIQSRFHAGRPATL